MTAKVLSFTDKLLNLQTASPCLIQASSFPKWPSYQ